jgi:hypothetical protein
MVQRSATIGNPQRTLGKYRYLTCADWQAVQNAITPTCGLARVTHSISGKEVLFSRAEVEFLVKRFGGSR